MRRAVLLLSLLLSTLAPAQVVSRIWLKTSSFPGTDSYEDMAIDAAGNIFVCGTTLSPVTNKIAMLVVKYDRLGIKQYEKVFPSAGGHSVAKCIAIDTVGNAYVAGQTNWTPPGDGISRIIKLSPTGGLVYDTIGAPATGSYWHDVAVDAVGEASATGYVDNGAGKLMRTGHFLANGTLAWNRDYSYPGIATVDQRGIGVELDSSGNIYACGVNNAFPNGAFNTVAKYSRTADQVWLKHISDGSSNFPRAFAKFDDFALFIACDVTTPSGVQTIRHSISMADGGTFGLGGGGFGNLRTQTVGAAVTPDRSAYVAGNLFNQSNQPSGMFRAYTVTGALQGISQDTSILDVRAICAGPGKGEHYFATLATGSGPRPTTIYGMKLLDFSSDERVFEEKLFGSTANGQTPFAIVNKLLVDPSGDLVGVGYFSGAQGQDAFAVKYECGPLAQDDVLKTPMNTTTTSEFGGYLNNDAQRTQAQFIQVAGPFHGVFSPQANGTFTYQPDPDFAGVDTVYYRLERTNGVLPHRSEAQIQMRVFPELTAASISPTTIHAHSIATLSASVAHFVNAELPLDVTVSPQLVLITRPLTILKDRYYGTGLITTSTVSSTQTITITIKSGPSTKVVTLTIMP